MQRAQKKLERKQRKAKIRAAQYAAAAERKNQKSKAKERPVKNGYSSAVLQNKRKQKRFEAEQRQNKWNSLSPDEKLIALKNRPGKSEKQIKKIKAASE